MHDAYFVEALEREFATDEMEPSELVSRHLKAGKNLLDEQGNWDWEQFAYIIMLYLQSVN